MDAQRDLPIAQAEQSREAYAEAVGGCGLGPTAEAVALWVIEVGEKEIIRIPIDGRPDQVNRGISARLPGVRKLGRRIGRHHSSICRGLKELEDAGLAIRPAGRIIVNLTRMCDLADARATERKAVSFARGWRAGGEPAESEPGRVVQGGAERCRVVQGGAERCRVVQGGAPGGSTRAGARPIRETKKLNKPECLTETEPRVDAPHRTAPHHPAPPCTGGDARGPLARLNRSAAWQALQAADFADADGRRTTPPVAKLWAAFGAAAAIGLVADDLDHELRWFATVHDCAAHARSPAAALAWRTASGKLSWAGNESWTWAKRLLASPPADDEPIAAMASSCKLSDELIAAMAAARDLPGDPP